MNVGIKLALFVILSVGACIFGYLAYQNYSELMAASSEPASGDLTDVPALSMDEESVAVVGYSGLVTCGLLFVLMVIGLGILFGHELSQFIGSRAAGMLYDDSTEEISDPLYEQAEQEWANGNHLEAIRLMREFLGRNPRQQHVTIRIAEIYEKDLNNPLAAALEYEEVLKHRLMPERWGWTAIHLCNLYIKLGQQDKAVALLHRIETEYPETAAADKARKRLDQTEGEDRSKPKAATASSEPSQPQTQPTPPPDDNSTPPKTPSNLPPGFSVRK